MSAEEIVAAAVCTPLGLGVLALIIHVFVEGAEDKLWPRGLRWLPGRWLDGMEALHRLALRVFWPEKLPVFKGRKVLLLESYDQQWRTWQGISDGEVPQWKPWPGRTGGRWEPRPVEKELCPCGYGDECPVHCGAGHTNGSCPAHPGTI